MSAASERTYRASGRVGRIARAVLVVAAAVLGTGAAAALGADDPAGPPPGVAAQAPQGTGVSAVDVAASGNVTKEFGEPAGLTAAEGDRAYFEITVRGVRAITDCVGRGVHLPPENGYFVVVDLTASVRGDVGLVLDGASEMFMPLTADAFEIVSDDGLVHVETQTDAAWACFDDSDLSPPFVGAGETASGLVVLDSPVPSGTLVYAPGGRGWEWRFGA